MAHDTILTRNMPEEIQRVLDCLVSEGRKVGLVINSRKTEIINIPIRLLAFDKKVLQHILLIKWWDGVSNTRIREIMGVQPADEFVGFSCWEIVRSFS